jgi:hypothetical protein
MASKSGENGEKYQMKVNVNEEMAEEIFNGGNG